MIADNTIRAHQRRRWPGWPAVLLAGLIGLAPAGGSAAPAHAATTYAWEVVPSPNPYPPPDDDAHFYGVTAFSPTDVWAVGSGAVTCHGCTHETTLAEHWDGTAWTIVPTPSPSNGHNYLYGIAALAASDIWAVGHADSYGSLVEHWDGSAWSLVPSRNTGNLVTLRAVAARTPSDIWAVGSYDNDGVFSPLAEHWNGNAWAITPAPKPSNSSILFTGVTALAADDVWAVTSIDFYSSLRPPAAPVIEHWNGSAWSIVANAAPRAGLLAVSAVTANDIWAVGWQGGGGVPVQALTEHWDGATWSVVAVPSQVGALWGVAARANKDVWAVGTDTNGHALLLHWNGLRWWIDPGPNASLGGPLYAVAADAPRDAWAVGGPGQTLAEHYH